MTGEFHSRLGGQLWRYLPAIYRSRDNGDLARYLDSFGVVLDQVHATLEQRLRDSFPHSCQSWLLPYLAELLDVRLVSPETQGRRHEVANAVAWRKRKGTLAVVEEIAEKVGDSDYERMEIEPQEGWKRVARTARVDVPLLSPAALGSASRVPVNTRSPILAASHPGLPAATPDLRHASRAEQEKTENAATHWTRFASQMVMWQQRNPRGTPCFPGSYQDASMRTVDLRSADWVQGHYHPRRLLLYSTPSAGFFPAQAPVHKWDNGLDWQQFATEAQSMQDGLSMFVEMRNPVEGKAQRIYHIQNRDKTTTLKITGRVEIDLEHGDNEELVFRFQGLFFSNTLLVKQGRVELERVAASKVEVHSSEKIQPALFAKNSLLQKIHVAQGLARLEYVTLLEPSITEIIQASDCIILGNLRKDLDKPDPPRSGCIRFSHLTGEPLGEVNLHANTTESVIFINNKFAQPGCGVLHPATADSICYGGEDGGEMGAYHHRHHCLRREALLEKLRDFLPVGIEPVFVPDNNMACAPPK